MNLPVVYRRSEDGVYPRVDGIARHNLCLSPRDFKLDASLRQAIPILGSS